jgi:hypothetical protein
MTRHTNRLPGWHRLTLYTSGAVLLASGLLWLALHYSVGGGAGGLPHPLEAWAMRLHGLAAFAGLFVLGVIAGSHIPHGWRMSGRQRWAPQRGTGLMLALLGGALVLTGYLLYYFAPETVRPALGWLHTGVGLAMGAALAVHQRSKSRHFAG